MDNIHLLKLAEFDMKMKWIRNSTSEVLIEFLKTINMDISEKQIIKSYEKLQNIDRVLDYLLDSNRLILNTFDDEQYYLISEAFFTLIHQTIMKNYDIETLNDAFYFEIRIVKLQEVPKKQKQEKILGIIRSTVEYAKSNNLSRLKDVYDVIDFNNFLCDSIKFCYNRDKYFKQVIKELYDTFEDVDRSIYKI